MNKVRVFEVWNESANRREVERIVFEPKGCDDDDDFNIYRGLRIKAEDCEDADESDCQAALDHIKQIWCKGDEAQYEYIMNFLAFCVQKPGEKAAVVPCLKSKEGAGKTIIMGIMDQIIGDDHFVAVSNPETILDKFNSAMEGKLFIVLEEMLWGGNKKDEQILKALISDKDMSIRKLYAEAYKAKNYANFMIMTNNDWFIPMSPDGRRYHCLELDNRWAGPSTPEKKAYFDKLRDPGIVKSFAKHLYGRDLSNFNSRQFEKTDLAQDQVEKGWDSVTSWWKQVLEEGRIEATMATVGSINTTHHTYDLAKRAMMVRTQEDVSLGRLEKWKETDFCFKHIIYAAYRQTYSGYGKQVKEGEFWKKLKGTDGMIHAEEKKKSWGESRKLAIVMPTLDSAREQFDKHQTFQYPWTKYDAP